MKGIDRPAKMESGSRINPGSSKSGVEPRLAGGQMHHPGICAVRRRADFTRRLSSQRCSPRGTVPCKKLEVRILHYNVTLLLVRWKRASGCGYVLAWPSQTAIRCGVWPRLLVSIQCKTRGYGSDPSIAGFFDPFNFPTGLDFFGLWPPARATIVSRTTTPSK